MDLRPFTVRDAARGIYLRKGRIIIFAIVIFAIVVVTTILAPKSYYSESKLFVRLGRENAVLDPTTTLGEGPSVSVPLSREDEINSIVELMKSKSLLEKVVDAVGSERILDRGHNNTEGDDPSTSVIDTMAQWLKKVGLMNDITERERAIIELRNSIGVNAIRKSNVISIGFESHSPELAQEVVGSLVDGYVTQHVSFNRSSGSVKFLRDQTCSALNELTDAEKNFENFKNRTGMLSLIEQRNVLVERMATLQNGYLQSVADSESLKSEIARLKEDLENLSKTVEITRTIGAGNEGVDGMSQEMFRLEMKYEEQLALHSSNHPTVQQIKKQLERSKKILEKAQQQTIESVTGRNTVYDETKVELHKKEPLYRATLAKSAILLSQMENVKSKLAQFNSNETEFVELQRVVAIKDEKYRRYAKNLQQAEIDYSLESQQLSNITIAQVATLNPKPIRPKKLVNLALGLFAGLFGGCGLAVLLEYFDTSIRSREDVEAALDLPIVAAIPSLRQQQQPDTYASNV